MIVKKLEKALSSKESIFAFIENDLIELSDSLSINDFEILFNERDKLYALIAGNQNLITEVPINNSSIKFIYLLIEISQRLGHRSNFLYLLQIIEDNGFNIGSRIEAASLFYGYGVNGDILLQRFEAIHNKLQYALIDEADQEILVYTCFIDYYTFLVVHFNIFTPYIIKNFHNKVLYIKKNNKDSFLNHPIIEDILDIPLSDINYAIIQFNKCLEGFKKNTLSFIANKSQNLSIEKNSDYCNSIEKNTIVNFNTFLTISKSIYKKYFDTSVYKSLNRGIEVIETPMQLAGYMHSFGEMHAEKIKSTFHYLLEIHDYKEIDVFDWGCGQAISSICFCDNLKSAELINIINKIILIEPSTLAIKRAGYNLSHYIPTKKIKLINKDINNIASSDISSNTIPKVHFFSNILDVETFSIQFLVTTIKTNFKGLNYFICTSPKLPSPRDIRIQLFVKEFNKNQSFKMLFQISQGKGEWRIDKQWTRTIYVFKLEQ